MSSSQQSPGKDLVYDPDQDPAEKREIRRKYRSLQKAIDDPHAEHTPIELKAKVGEANQLFPKVKNPQLATLDSAFFVKTTTISIGHARTLKFGTGTFDLDDFVTRLITFMGGHKPPDDLSAEASDVEEDDSPLEWGKLGRCALAKSRRVPAMGFMLGPLSMEQKQRSPRRRAKLQINKNDERRPQEIREEDIARSENETTKNVALLATALEQVEKINLFKLVINPHNFAQSVENIFYLSFLIRDAKVAFEISELVACHEPTDEDREAAGGVLLRQQLILEFDMATWKTTTHPSSPLSLPFHLLSLDMSSKVILATTPPFFNGDKTKWNNFHDSLSTYIAAYDDELNTNKKKVFFTVSFLRNADGTDCTASDWVRNWKKRTFVNCALPTTYTFDQLIVELEAAFKDQNLAQLAHLKLTTTRQGKMSLVEFFQHFELYAEQAGYSPNSTTTGYNAFLVELLEDLVGHEIISQIYLGGQPCPPRTRISKPA
ncbi:Nse4 C-terminal-domain-containing protein [Mycena capillaripes]|nr:Nse4 C-terminal-domain-containing protein [Mycena capillaripes]